MKVSAFMLGDLNALYLQRARIRARSTLVKEFRKEPSAAALDAAVQSLLRLKTEINLTEKEIRSYFDAGGTISPELQPWNEQVRPAAASRYQGYTTEEWRGRFELAERRLAEHDARKASLSKHPGLPVEPIDAEREMLEGALANAWAGHQGATRNARLGNAQVQHLGPAGTVPSRPLPISDAEFVRRCNQYIFIGKQITRRVRGTALDAPGTEWSDLFERVRKYLNEVYLFFNEHRPKYWLRMAEFSNEPTTTRHVEIRTVDQIPRLIELHPGGYAETLCDRIDRAARTLREAVDES